MAAFNAVWSIDIGKYALKAVHLRKMGSQVMVLKTDRVDYEVGSEGVDSVGGPKEALQIFCSRNAIHDPVVVSIQGRDALPRFIKVMADNDKKLQELVNYEARQQIPFDIDDVIWDWHLIKRDYAKGQEKDVGLFAARREAVDDVLLDLEAHNLKSQLVVPGYLGVLNYIQYEVRPKVPSIVLDIGANHTSLILVENNSFWVRELTFSGNKVTQELARRFGLDFSEAERLKMQAGKSQQAQKIYAALQGVLGSLVTEIRQSISHYHRSQDTEAEFNTIYLVGQASATLGLGKYLKDKLRWRVQRINKLSRIRGGEGADIATIRTQLPGLSTALGVGLQGLGVSQTSVDLMPHEQQIKLAFNRRRKMVFVAGAVLLLIMFVIGRQVKRDIAKVDTAVKAADVLLKDIKDARDQMPDADAMDKQLKQIEAIRKIGMERDFLSLAIMQVDAALKDVAKGTLDQKPDNLAHLKALSTPTEKTRSVFLTRESDQLEGEKEAKKLADIFKQSNLSVFSLDVTLSGAEEDKASGGGRSGRRNTEEEEQVKPVQYHFILTGAIYGKDNTAESLKEVRQRFIEPLKARFKQNDFINRHLVREPEPQTIDAPEIEILAPREGDKFFSKQWFMVDTREMESKVGDDNNTTTSSMNNPLQYFKFTVEWVIGEGKPVPADATEDSNNG